MRYLMGIDAGRGEGVLCTETGIALRYLKPENGNVLQLIQKLTEKMPVATRQTGVHICLGDRADSVACDRIEAEVKKSMGEKALVVCEDRMVHRIYSCFETAESGIALYAYPDAGAGRLHAGGLATIGGIGAPFWSAGSSYLLGIKTIRAALSAADRTGRPTVLTSLLEQAVGLPMEDVKSELREKDAAQLAAYGRLAVRGKALGDAVATKLVEEMLASLAEYVYALSLPGEHTLVKITEVPNFLHPLLEEALGEMLGERYTVSCFDAPILLGAVRRAAEMLRLSTDANFCRTFLETFQVVCK